MTDLLWVGGGRDFTDIEIMRPVLHLYLHSGWNLITGAAPGADRLAEKIWKDEEGAYTGVPAEWSRYGKIAGRIRNEKIAIEWQPQRLITFPGGTGTAHAREVAERLDIEHLYGPDLV